MSVEFDKMMGALGMLSGSKAGAQKAFDAASAMYAPVEEVNPWEASLRFFLEMGKQASQPGATVFGSAVGAGLVPLDYLAAKKKEKRDRDQKVASTAFSLAPSLKPKAGKVTYRPATADELKQYGKTSGQMGSDGKFYDLSKTTGTGSTTFGQYLLTTPESIAAYKAQGPAFTLTPEQEAGTAPVTISANVLRTAGGFTKYEKAGSGAADDLKTFALLNPDDLTKIQEVVPNASIDALGNILLTDAESKKAGVRQFIGQKVTDGDSSKAPKTDRDEFDVLRYSANPPEGKVIGDRVYTEDQSAGFTKAQVSFADGLRDDLARTLTDFDDIKSTHKKTAGFYFNPNAVSDYSLAVNYAKIVDPGTAAREGEVAAIAGAGSLSGAFRAALTNALMGTGKLSPQMRAQIYNSSLRIYEAELAPALAKINRYETASENLKAGLWELAGLNVDKNSIYSVADPDGVAFGAGRNSNANTYNYVDESSIAPTQLDTSPTYNFPPDFDFATQPRSYLLGLLRLPTGALDRQTLITLQGLLEQ